MRASIYILNSIAFLAVAGILAAGAAPGSEAEGADLADMVGRSGAEVWPNHKVPSSSGFLVSPKGVILTVAHGVAGCPLIDVRLPGEDGMVPATLIGLDARYDLAALRVAADNAASASIAETTKGIGVDRVLLAGYTNRDGRDDVLTIEDGVVTGNVSGIAPAPVMDLRGRLIPGMSGGLVLDARGEVAGMIVGRKSESDSRGIAIPARDFSVFLRNVGVTPAAKSGRAKSNASAENEARRIGVLVQCRRVVQCPNSQ